MELAALHGGAIQRGAGSSTLSPALRPPAQPELEDFARLNASCTIHL